jgi:transposase
MVTDRGKSYDAIEWGAVARQKCLWHLIRNASAVIHRKSGVARQFGTRLKEILRGSIRLWREKEQGDVPGYEERVKKTETELTHHLRNRAMQDKDNQRWLNGIGLQDDHGNVLRFLRPPGIEPAHNRAERALPPAVIARKVSPCSKNQRAELAFRR